MPDLLFELGCEELPAGAVAQASRDLESLVTSRLTEAGLEFGRVRSLCTPRRLILGVEGLPEGQADRVEESRGPSESAAFANGVPTRALEGFCRGKGVDPGSVEVRDGYVWVKQEVKGRATAEVLAEVLPEAVRAMTFPKTMRWGANRMRFARPIRWILAILGGRVVDFEIEGVVSGASSRGHRFDFPEEFVAGSFDELVDELRRRHVEPDAEARRDKIVREARQVASGAPDLPEALVDENVFLTEWPTAHEGRFDEAFLELPEPVLVTAMAKHERFFPVRGDDEKLVNRFVSIRNSGEEESVKAGNEWVLNARFNDAQFFYEEDKGSTLKEFLQDTERMLFQEKLGTVLDRAGRLANLAGVFAKVTGADDEETRFAREAGRLAKADLACGLVEELSSLQGVIGGVYARRDGLPEPVCAAIAGQYDLGKSLPVDSAERRTAVRLIVADQVDKLAGFLGLGLIPKGSSDPFGLRRAATVLIEAAWAWPGILESYENLFDQVFAEYAVRGVELDAAGAKSALVDLMTGRYEVLMPDLAHDVLEAAVSTSVSVLLDPKRVRVRAQAVAVLDKDVAFIQTMRRPLNILAAAQRDGGVDLPDAVSPEGLDSESGVALATEAMKAQTEIRHQLNQEQPALAAEQLQRLAGFIHDFFESTMVMAEDAETRRHRLGLVAETAETVSMVGDFTKIVLEGEKKG